MRLFTYECSICGDTVERESTAPAPKRCLVCGGQMNKKYPIPNIVYKGTDWTGAQSKERKDA